MKKAKAIFLCILLFFSVAVAACSGGASYSIPSNTELFHVIADHAIYPDLSGVETNSALIVEGVVKDNLGQKVSSDNEPAMEMDIPVYGCNRWEVQVTKVYKGDVKEGSAITYGQEYYLCDKPDGSKLMMICTAQKPVSVNKKYLFFLTAYDDHYECYYAAGDYEGKFAIPSDELKAKAKAGTWTPDDLELYNNDSLQNLDTVYKEVVEKYFSK